MRLEETGGAEEGDQGQLEWQSCSEDAPDPTVGKTRLVVGVSSVRGAAFHCVRRD